MTNLDIIKQKMHKVNDEWVRVRNEMYERNSQEAHWSLFPDIWCSRGISAASHVPVL